MATNPVHDRAKNEERFIHRIDCAFPYHDQAASAAVLREAASISANAELMTLLELLVLPRGARVSAELQQRLLTDWSAASRSRLCHAFARVATTKLDSGASRDAAAQLEAIATQLPRAQNALALLEWFVFELWTDDELDASKSRIRRAWSTASE